jgi:RNA polymerase sigma-70 factor (ECF subfamily)
LSFAHTYTDQELLLQLRAGNQEAFTILYNQFSGAIYFNVLKMVKDETVAEEIVQEIFIKIWQKRDVIRIEVSFASYIYRIAQNNVIDYFRKIERSRDLLERFKKSASSNYLHVEENICLKESDLLLQKAIATLPPQQKKVYQLCVLEGYTYKDTACQMEIGLNTVKEYLQKARVTVRTFLEKNMDNPYALLVVCIADIY